MTTQEKLQEIYHTVSKMDIMELKKSYKDFAINFDKFMAITLIPMLDNVVSFSFIIILSILKQRFSKLKSRSTAIRSALSWNLIFLSRMVPFLGRPKAGPESLIPRTLQ